MEALPDDIEALKRLIACQAAELAASRKELKAAKAGLAVKTLEIEKLKVQLARLQRLSFGQSSERYVREIAQLTLQLEELEATEAAAAEAAARSLPAEEDLDAWPPKRRRDLPVELPRTDVVHQPADACCTCGGAMREVGEDVTEILEYRPGRFEVIRHIRPAYSCRACEAMAQAPMPPLPIPRGYAGPGLLAHMLIGKYCDHVPLYRQSQIYARDGVDLDRALLADWAGRAAWLVDPLVEAIARHVKAGETIHVDDTPIPVLAPGRGKTKEGRLWVYLRDERPHCGEAPPAVLYRYTPDRKGEHPQTELAGFKGFLHADGYSGFNALYQRRDGEPPPIIEVACWSHVRRKFYDLHQTTKAPLAAEAIERIGALFEIERAAKGKSAAERRALRREHASPRLESLAGWFDGLLTKLSGKSDMAAAIRYARSRWTALTRYTDDGRLEISNNAAERAIRPISIGRKNYLFAGSNNGGVTAARFYTLIETAKLHGLDPQAYLRCVLERIGGHPINRIDELLPWNLGTVELKAAA